MSPSPFLSEFDDADLVDLFTELGVQVEYRRAFAPASNPASWLGPRTQDGPGYLDPPPVGSRDSAYDPGQQAIIDTTVDAATGYVGGYQFVQIIRVLWLAPSAPAAAAFTPYGMELREGAALAVILARDLAPLRGDLLIHPDGDRYVVGEEQRPLGLYDRPIAFAVQVERRAATDPAYTA